MFSSNIVKFWDGCWIVKSFSVNKGGGSIFMQKFIGNFGIWIANSYGGGVK